MNYQTIMASVFSSIALFCGGCGTLENLQEATPPNDINDKSLHSIYGGVRKDCCYLSHPVDEKSQKEHDRA